MISGSSSWRHIVTVPVVSVSPYPVTTVSKPQLVAHAADQLDRDGRGAGDGEAQRRQVELADVGWLRMVWKIAGGPGSMRDALLGDPSP